jgi:hypothetical protein
MSGRTMSAPRHLAGRVGASGRLSRRAPAAQRHHAAAPDIDTTVGGPSTKGQDTGRGATERRTSVSAAGGGSTFEMRHERPATPKS